MPPLRWLGSAVLGAALTGSDCCSSMHHASLLATIIIISITTLAAYLSSSLYTNGFQIMTPIMTFIDAYVRS